MINDGGRVAIEQLVREMSNDHRIGWVDLHQTRVTAVLVAVAESQQRAPVVILNGMTFNQIDSLRSAADKIKKWEPGVYEGSEICGNVAGAALILAVGAEFAAVGGLTMTGLAEVGVATVPGVSVKNLAQDGRLSVQYTKGSCSPDICKWASRPTCSGSHQGAGSWGTSDRS